MPTITDINLLKSADASGKLFILDAKLRLIAIWSIGVLLAGGLIMGGAYFFITTRTQNMANSKNTLIVQIQQQNVKEGMLLTLKQRIAVADKALKAAFPWGKLFPILGSIAPTNFFTGISIDESGRVTLTMVLPTIDDAVTTVQNMITASNNDVIRSGQLSSFSLQQDGTVQMGFTMIPNLLL